MPEELTNKKFMNLQRKPCPYCGESIAINAKKCRFCGEWIEIPSDRVQSNTQTHTSPILPDTSSDSTPKQEIPQTPQVATPNTSPAQPDNSAEEKSYFHKYIKEPFITRFSDFSGYTSRKDYWMTILYYNILSLGVIGLGFILMFGADFYLGGIIVFGLYYLSTLIPSLALTIRRLRDGGKNPWSILLAFIPFLGPLILIIIMCLPSQYEYPAESIKFGSADYIFLIGCAASFIVGICLLASAASKAHRDYYDEDYYSTFYNAPKPGYEIVEAEEVDGVVYEDEVEVVEEVDYAEPVY